ncbi:MAG: hypothetical protein V4675_00060 [Verrucomicrobiota bacterium]
MQHDAKKPRERPPASEAAGALSPRQGKREGLSLTGQPAQAAPAGSDEPERASPVCFLEEFKDW